MSIKNSKNSNSFFNLKSESKWGRRGVISTAHGQIQTPAFVPVGTQATIKSLTNSDILSLNIQIFFVNTYHIMLRPGVQIIKKAGGLHKFMNWNGPIITDSGGFQVFSLGRSKPRGNRNHDDIPTLVRIDEDGVTFKSHWDGKEHRLTAEKSIELQHAFGADLIIAFDDCATYPITYDSASASVERTHNWAKKSLESHKKLNKSNNKKLALYGVVQGSVYRDLREKSSQYIKNMDFDGIAIGGVSVGESKEEMENVLRWTIPNLPKGKPRHLLGVGEVDDVFKAVKYGIDTFDCVLPTRNARMGHLLIKSKDRQKNKKWTIDITKSLYKDKFIPIEKDCGCYTCKNHTQAYLHHLFKVRELLGYHLATIHNLHFMEELILKIRKSLGNDTFEKVAKNYGVNL